MSQIILRAAVREGLKDAFLGYSFNICGVASVCKALGRDQYVQRNPDWDALRVIHCMNWAKLTPAERHEVLTVAFRVMGITLNDANIQTGNYSNSPFKEDSAVDTALNMLVRIG
jgi:hypothetical protein